MLLMLMLFGSHGGFLSEFFNHALDALVEFKRHVKCCKLVHIEAALSLPEEHFIVKTRLLDLFVLVLLEPFDSFALFP